MEKYSVLMSVYHKEQPDNLRRSIESMLSQTAAPEELVLVCDGPLTEALEQVIAHFLAQEPRILQVHRLQTNQGLAKALNFGLSVCRNDLVARMDSDDIAVATRCELQLQKFAEDSDLAIAGGAVDEFSGIPENVLSHKDMPQTQAEILCYGRRRNPFNHPSVMFRRSQVSAAGGYPENYPLHEDYALWVAMLQSGAKACNLPQTLCCMRVDNGMYARRGGWRYLKTAIRFRKHLYRTGWCSLGDYLYVSAALTAACLVPTSLRKLFYLTYLRK